MYSRWLFAIVLLAIAGQSLGSSEHWGQLHQDDIAAPSNVDSGTQPTSTGLAPASLPNNELFKEVRSPVTTGASTPASASVVTSIKAASINTNTTSMSTPQNPSTLPLAPVITPALAVAGFILIISGVAYILVGIQRQWIQVFLSALCLTSLAITVLIVHLEAPPVGNALQGAYLVGIVGPALVVGTISLKFKNLVERIACFLGGFCLSMWFLVLKPGGLIPSTGPKIAFIVILTLATFCCSFHRYTKTYAMHGSTSFAGATAIVLGIDCVSRVGLKEFWLFIWNINGSIFPQQTTTYPITKGMIIEIVAIVVLCLFGILFQMKLWHLIKRGKQDRMLFDDLENGRRLSTTVGNSGSSLGESSAKEQKQWEGDNESEPPSAYPHKDSGLGTEVDMESVRKDSMSNVESRDIEPEMPSISMALLEHHERHTRLNYKRISGTVDEYGLEAQQSLDSTSTVSISSSNASPTAIIHGESSGVTSAEESHAPTQLVEVLPVDSSPNRDSQVNQDVDALSLASTSSSGLTDHRTSTRLSGSSLMKRLSLLAPRLSLPSALSSEAQPTTNLEIERSSRLSLQEGLLKPNQGYPEQTEMQEVDGQTPALEMGTNDSKLTPPVPPLRQKFSFEAEDAPEIYSQSEPAAPPLETPDVSVSRPVFHRELSDETSKVVLARRAIEWARQLGSVEKPPPPEVDALNTRPNTLESRKNGQGPKQDHMVPESTDDTALEYRPKSTVRFSSDTSIETPRRPPLRPRMPAIILSSPRSVSSTEIPWRPAPRAPTTRTSGLAPPQTNHRPKSLSQTRAKSYHSVSPLANSPITEGVEAFFNPRPSPKNSSPTMRAPKRPTSLASPPRAHQPIMGTPRRPASIASPPGAHQSPMGPPKRPVSLASPSEVYQPTTAVPKRPTSLISQRSFLLQEPGAIPPLLPRTSTSSSLSDASNFSNLSTPSTRPSPMSSRSSSATMAPRLSQQFTAPPRQPLPKDLRVSIPSQHVPFPLQLSQSPQQREPSLTPRQRESQLLYHEQSQPSQGPQQRETLLAKQRQRESHLVRHEQSPWSSSQQFSYEKGRLVGTGDGSSSSGKGESSGKSASGNQRMSLEEAHRDVMRKMQAAANKALAENERKIREG